jgi:hypothetical protein
LDLRRGDSLRVNNAHTSVQLAQIRSNRCAEQGGLEGVRVAFSPPYSLLLGMRQTRLCNYRGREREKDRETERAREIERKRETEREIERERVSERERDRAKERNGEQARERLNEKARERGGEQDIYIYVYIYIFICI